MENYKPEYMGKVIPADDPAKLTDFVTNKYDAFSKCYDACKDYSDRISDVSSVSTPEGDSSFSMKVNTDAETLNDISKSLEDDVNISDNVITAK